MKLVNQSWKRWMVVVKIEVCLLWFNLWIRAAINNNEKLIMLIKVMIWTGWRWRSYIFEVAFGESREGGVESIGAIVAQLHLLHFFLLHAVISALRLYLCKSNDRQSPVSFDPICERDPLPVDQRLDSNLSRKISPRNK